MGFNVAQQSLDVGDLAVMVHRITKSNFSQERRRKHTPRQYDLSSPILFCDVLYNLRVRATGFLQCLFSLVSRGEMQTLELGTFIATFTPQSIRLA